MRVDLGMVVVPPLQERAASRVKAKKDTDFVDLYRTHAPRVIAVAMHRLSDLNLAEDVVQETFLRVYRDIDKLDPTKPAWPWLSAIVMNLCSDEWQIKKLSAERLSSQPQEEAENLIELDSDPADQYVIRERIRAVMTTLERISARHRRALLLKYGKGLRDAEIAAQEEISVTAAESLLKRARESFRVAYEKVVKERGLEAISWPVIGAAIYRLRSRLSRAQYLVMNALRPSNIAAFLNSIEGLVATATVALTVIVGAALLYPVTENAFAQPTSLNSGNSGSGNPGASSDGTETLNEKPYEVSHTIRSRDHVQEGPAATVTAQAGLEKGDKPRLGARVDESDGETDSWVAASVGAIDCDQSTTAALACLVINTLPDD